MYPEERARYHATLILGTGIRPGALLLYNMDMEVQSCMLYIAKRTKLIPMDLALWNTIHVLHQAEGSKSNVLDNV
jgi:hypothetical protein